MIKRTIFALLLALTIANTATAGEFLAPKYGTWYVRGDVGVGFSKDYDVVVPFFGPVTFGDGEGVAVGAGLGYQFNENFRGDITFDAVVGYSLNFGAELDTFSVLANRYIDVPIDGVFRPYIGAGLGYGWADASVFGLSDSEDGFALAGMVGLSFDMTENMAFDIAYKFRHIFIDYEDVQDHMARAGLRVYY